MCNLYSTPEAKSCGNAVSFPAFQTFDF
jgi:hypothetical protein